MILGTRQDPSLFEIPSSIALAVLSGGIVPTKRTAAAMLMNSFEVTKTSPENRACTVPILASQRVSTTQLGLARIDDDLDTLEKGTLN
jgi:hypothetical protein